MAIQRSLGSGVPGLAGSIVVALIFLVSCTDTVRLATWPALRRLRPLTRDQHDGAESVLLQGIDQRVRVVEVEVERDTQLLLRIAPGGEERIIAVSPRHLVLRPDGLLLGTTFVPRRIIAGLEVEQPSLGRSIGLAIGLGLGLVGVIALVFVVVQLESAEGLPGP